MSRYRMGDIVRVRTLGEPHVVLGNISGMVKVCSRSGTPFFTRERNLEPWNPA